MDVISVGSAENVWGFKFTSHGPNVFQFAPGSGWVMVDSPKPASVYFAVVACPDGSVWLGSAQTVLLKRSSGEDWKHISSRDLSGSIITSYGAASRQGLVVVHASAALGISALTIGIADQPTDGWPPQTPGEATAYVAISQELGIGAAGGIRAEYTNTAERYSFSDWRADLLSMSCPQGVDPDDFARVQKQLAEELHRVHVVYGLFENIKELNHEFMSLASLMLPPIATMVGLSERTEDKGRVFHAVLGTMVETAIVAMVFFVAGPAGAGGALAIKLIYSGLKAGVNAATNGPKPPDYRLEVAYSKFADTMSAKWQIVHVLVDDTLVPINSIPLSAQIYVGHEKNGKPTGFDDLWFCNELGSSRTVQEPMTCRFPSAALMDAVTTAIFR
jgi:hypothetical protein